MKKSKHGSTSISMLSVWPAAFTINSLFNFYVSISSGQQKHVNANVNVNENVNGDVRRMYMNVRPNRGDGS